MGETIITGGWYEPEARKLPTEPSFDALGWRFVLWCELQGAFPKDEWTNDYDDRLVPTSELAAAALILWASVRIDGGQHTDVLAAATGIKKWRIWRIKQRFQHGGVWQYATGPTPKLCEWLREGCTNYDLSFLLDAMVGAGMLRRSAGHRPLYRDAES